MPRSSRGLGRRPFTAVARVRIPYAVLFSYPFKSVQFMNLRPVSQHGNSEEFQLHLFILHFFSQVYIQIHSLIFAVSASLKFVRSKVEKLLLLTYEKITIYRIPNYLHSFPACARA